MIPAMIDTDHMPFGMHKGKALANVPAKYLIWLHEQGVVHEGVKKYIINNLDVLTKEAAKADAYKRK